MNKETDEQRIKRLEGTVDALRYNLENLAKQLLLLEIQSTNSDEANDDIRLLMQSTSASLHTILSIRSCKRDENK